ncbi:hypothetical protein BMS3Bbin14_01069 [bacterium BMS3Bbin14]|nr:hypothetical protein BMS3Abin13_01877 [bacterium BMS3Abin13]GBE52595.1 hypothetical protein BMS3Bbin14_01069 [bacterium BMS3Bbin14]HDO31434.1 hypothetical protein [Desulfobacteraceae bacterium]
MERALQWPIFVIRLLWTALREFIPALCALWRDLIRRIRGCYRRKKLPERDRRRTYKRCVPISSSAFKKPDPLIYSQEYLLAQGFAVTWDNPDIQLFKNGVAVSSSSLDADTEYEIVARIWNNSTEAPVIGMPVRFSYRSFGVGAKHYPINDTVVNLGVKGGVNHPTFAKVIWRTPKTAGHYCIKVFLDWMDDANPGNNLGQENTNVQAVQSPAHFTFTLHNTTHETQKYKFKVDAYQIPGRQPCDKLPRLTHRVKITAPSMQAATEAAQKMLALHAPSNYPIPPGFEVSIEPENPELAPGEKQPIHVTVDAPDGFTGQQPININAFYSYGCAGGVTLYVDGR